MAHSCHLCGHFCHCGGDIDDLVFDDSPAAGRCTHYRFCQFDEEDGDDDLDGLLGAGGGGDGGGRGPIGD
jgi:hypothetical protein